MPFHLGFLDEMTSEGRGRTGKRCLLQLARWILEIPNFHKIGTQRVSDWGVRNPNIIVCTVPGFVGTVFVYYCTIVSRIVYLSLLRVGI